MKTIKFRIIIVISTFIIFTLLNTISSIGLFEELKRSIDGLLISNQESIMAAHEMKDILNGIDRDLVEGYRHRDKEEKFLKEIEKSKKNITEKGEEELIFEIKGLFKEYIEQGQKGYNREIYILYKDLEEALDKLFNLNQGYVDKMNIKAEALAKQSMEYSFLILGGLLIVGLTILIYFLKKILNPIEGLWKGIKEISRGNLEYRIGIKRDEEINFILKEFNKMAERLMEYEKINIKKVLKENKKSEAIMESVNFPMIVTDKENRVTMINKNGRKVFKVKKEDVLNRKFKEGIKEGEVLELLKRSREDIDDKEYLKEIEIRNRYYRVVTRQIWFKDMENIGSVIVMQDITKFKELDKVKNDFLNTISHEFRTPLTSIAMATDILLLNSNKEDRELLEIIKMEEESLGKLVAELLLLSKLEEGKVEMKKEVCSLERVVLDVKNKFKLQLKVKNIKFIVDLQEKNCIGDKEKITWILNNLVGNAIRYTERGEIEIKSIKREDEIEISVKDTGIGLEEKAIEKIFDKFFQGENSEGIMGLGLCICKEIVRGHGGNISAENNKEGGAKFSFTLKESGH